ncbi:MAG: glycosyltransferase family 39 protein [bacterium]|nr:glycosyltransferase family 39 protein [bacterium]
MKKIETVFNKMVLTGLFILTLSILAVACKYLRITSPFMKAELGPSIKRCYVILIGVLLIGGVLYYAYKAIVKQTDRHTKLLSIMIFAVIIVLQIVYLTIITKAYPKTDNYTVLTSCMKMAREGRLYIENSSGYFANYTNNYFIVFFLYGFFRVMLFFKVDDLWNAVIVLNVLMIDLGILLTYYSVVKLRGLRQGCFIMFLIAICPTTYEWLTFTYTNTMSIPFAMALLYLAVSYREKKSRKAQTVSILLMGIIAGIGYLLRATIIIPVIAACIYLIFEIIRMPKEDKKFKHSLLAVGGFLLIFLLIIKGFGMTQKGYLSDPETKGRYPITHWLMLGVSESGGFSKEDSRFTSSFKEYDQKKEANMKEIKERLTERNLFKLYFTKLERVWADGSDECLGFNRRDTSEHSLFKYVNGNRNFVYVIYMQAYRVITLLGILLAIIKLWRTKKEQGMFLYALTLFGAILFFLLWEANTKYSISFLFIMLMLFEYGMESMDGACAKNMSPSIKYVVIAVTALAFLINGQVIISHAKQFTEKKTVMTNYIFEGKEMAYVKYKPNLDHATKLVQQFETMGKFNTIEISAKKEAAKADHKASPAVYKISLLNEDGITISEKTISTKDVHRNGVIKLECKTDLKHRKQKYTLVIERTSGNVNTLSFGHANSINFDYITGGSLTSDGMEQKNDLYMQVYQKEEETYVSKKAYYSIAGLILVLHAGLLGMMILQLKKKETV